MYQPSAALTKASQEVEEQLAKQLAFNTSRSIKPNSLLKDFKNVIGKSGELTLNSIQPDWEKMFKEVTPLKLKEVQTLLSRYYSRQDCVDFNSDTLLLAIWQSVSDMLGVPKNTIIPRLIHMYTSKICEEAAALNMLATRFATDNNLTLDEVNNLHAASNKLASMLISAKIIPGKIHG